MAEKSRKKKKTDIRLIIALLFVISFVTAIVAYFFNSFIYTERENAVYTSMEEPQYPVVFALTDGYEINPMLAHAQDMDASAADCITPLPENRKLDILIRNYGFTVVSLSYEVRSLDMAHFIEKTQVSDFTESERGLRATLPIQNIIEQDKQYLLKIQLDLGESSMYYYTRIMQQKKSYTGEMLAFAASFTEKTFDYNEARELTRYLETSQFEDNSSLGSVSIRSGFSQLTWAGSGMVLDSELHIRLREFDGMMCAAEVLYQSASTDESGRRDRYNNRDEFTMRMGSDRIYLMDYKRHTAQIFEGTKHLFSGSRILLGITTPDRLQTRRSPNGQYIVFKSDRELWSYDQKNKRAVNLFSFRSAVDDGLRADDERHDIRILTAEDNGDVDFVVYGHMNRGRHEAYNGIAYYRYTRASDNISELFFIPSPKSWEIIAAELQELCIRSDNGMFYLKLNDMVTAIDLKSLERVDVKADLVDGSYAISRDQSRMAWLEGGLYSGTAIRILDVLSGSTQTIEAAGDEYLRILGFMNNDLLCGSCGRRDQWYMHGRIKAYPCRKLSMIDEDMKVIKEYENKGVYMDHLRIEGNRIQVNHYKKRGTGYVYDGADTIVSNEEQPDLQTDGVFTAEHEKKKKIYYVALDEKIKTTRNLKISVPGSLSYENAGNVELLSSGNILHFCAYAAGRLQLYTTDFAAAVNACYEGMGWVCDDRGILLYNRTDRGTVCSIQEPMKKAQPLLDALDYFENSNFTKEGVFLLDGQGLGLQQAMYFVYKGFPVAAYVDESEFCLICGYDSNKLRLYYPKREDGAVLMDREEAEDLLTGLQSDFICFMEYKA